MVHLFYNLPSTKAHPVWNQVLPQHFDPETDHPKGRSSPLIGLGLQFTLSGVVTL